MKLFLDSASLEEIEKALDLGIISGVTTTPTFMHREGVTDVDAAIIKLSGMVPSLHVEALGDTYEDTIAEAHRISALPFKTKPVFKIPVSNVGVKACIRLVKEGHQVNLHLVYTLNQAYMAMEAGATFVGLLAGRLHDQGHDAMALVGQAVQAADRYNYASKVVVSSVRHPEHVRQALILGAHGCSVPWRVLRMLASNDLSATGAAEFRAHTKLRTVRVRELLREKNPVCKPSDSILDAMLQMTEAGLGSVSIVDGNNRVVGVLPEGDIRKELKARGKEVVNMKISDFDYKSPVAIDADALLYDAVDAFSRHELDNIVVVENDVPIGMIDIQALVKMGLLG